LCFLFWFPFESKVRYGICRLNQANFGFGKPGLDRQRLDKWVWHARIVRTRADAAALVGKGRVRVNGARETSPGHGVKTGDVLTIALDARVRVLKVIAFAERRGDADAALHLYEDLQPRSD
jgi:ribosome-associated heat shock protein Hsp15